MRRLAIFSVIGFVLLSPFYFWENGLPQLAHVFFAAVFTMTVLHGGLQIDLRGGAETRAVGLLAGFAFWAVAIDAIHSAAEASFEPLSNALYYVFGLFLALAMLNALHRYGREGARLIYNVFAATVILQALLSLIGVGRIYYGARGMGFFNNPNQLAYFAVFCCAYLIYFGRKLAVPPILHYCLLLLCVYLSVCSLSRAGLAAVGFALVIDFIFFEKNHWRWLAIALLVTALGLVFSETIFEKLLHLFSSARFGAGEKAGSLSMEEEFSRYRHYEFLIKDPAALLTGWGDGLLMRHFGTEIELHSTFGAALLNFGVIGFCLLVLFVINSFVADWPAAVASIGPVIVYGLTHNGLRNPLFFTLIAIVSARSAKK